jgi:hypothetical protein
MTPNSWPEDAFRYLQEHHVLTLATVWEGRPHAAALFYVADEAGRLYFLSNPASRHAQALAQNTRVAVTIQGEQVNWRTIRGLQIEGIAEPVVEAEEREGALRRYLARFPELQDLTDCAVRTALAEATVYCITPRWVRWIDNTKGFGHKEEWRPGRGP